MLLKLLVYLKMWKNLQNGKTPDGLSYSNFTQSLNFNINNQKSAKKYKLTLH